MCRQYNLGAVYTLKISVISSKISKNELLFF
nr:MAG TPA: Motility gene repressor [Inoviridae sp.]